MGSSPAGYARTPGTGCKTSTGAREGSSLGSLFWGGAYMDERELDRFAFEAGHYYDFRLATLVRQLREHRTMLSRYVTAHAAAAQAGTSQLPAATQALLEVHNDARALLGEPSPKMAESSKSWVTMSSVTSRSGS